MAFLPRTVTPGPPRPARPSNPRASSGGRAANSGTRGMWPQPPPEPRRHERQQHPAWNTKPTGHVRRGGVDGDDQINRRHQGGKAIEVARWVNACFMKKTGNAPLLVVDTVLQADEPPSGRRPPWSEGRHELLQTERAFCTGNRAPGEADTQLDIAVTGPQGGNPLWISDQIGALAGKTLRSVPQIPRQVTGRNPCHTVIHQSGCRHGRGIGIPPHHLRSLQRAPQQGNEAGIA